MYCRKCGQTLGNGDKFCPACGSAVIRETVLESTQFLEGGIYVGSNERKRFEVRELSKAINYFSQKESLYNDLHAKQDELMRLESSRGHRAFLVVFIVFAAMDDLFIAFGGLGAALRAFSGSAWGTFCMLLFLILTVTAVVMLVLFIKNINRLRQEKIRKKQEVDAAMAEVLEVYERYPACPVAVEWSDPVRLNLLWWTMAANRADSIKEAVNICTDENNRKQYEAEMAAAIRGAGKSIGTGAAVGGIAAGAGYVAGSIIRKL